jgi:small-conductance mechanosensitive channel
MSGALVPIGLGLATLVVGFIVLHLLRLTLRRAARRTPATGALSKHGRKPAHLAVVTLAGHVTIAGLPHAQWHRAAQHALLLVDIALMAWGVAAVLAIVIDVALPRFRTDVRDNRQARRVHTQVSVMQRMGIAALAVIAVGAMLLTFPAFRGAGASVLASAGIAGVIAGFAAQSLLGNVIAGMQLVFSDAVRLDDVVVVEEEWGRVEEITLTYVVVRIWDDRRLVLPTSYFMSTPFENWTRTEAAVIGAVELDVDWCVPMTPMRAELERVVKENERWDGRVCVLQVTEAIGATVRVRALVSAGDAPTLWDLRCDVREDLVTWLREHHPDALPKVRAEIDAPSPSLLTKISPRP